MTRFALSLLGIIQPNVWFAGLGIGSPCLKRVSREASSSGIAQLGDFGHTARPDMSEALVIGDVDLSQLTFKRLRHEDFPGMIGDSLESGSQGGHEAQNNPVALAFGGESQGRSCYEPTSDALNSENGGSLAPFAHDPLPDDLRLDFDNLYELEFLFSPLIVPGPENYQSIEQRADAEGKTAMVQDQVRHQLSLRDTDSYRHSPIRPLDQSGVSQRAREGHPCSPHEIGHFNQQDFNNCFHTHLKNCELGPSSDSNHEKLTKTLRAQIYPYNTFHSESFQEFFSPRPSLNNLNTHLTKNEPYIPRNGPSLFVATLPILDVNCPELGVDYKRCPAIGSISIHALEKYILPFTTTVNELLGNFQKKFQAIKSFQGISAAEVHYDELAEPLIRVRSEEPEELISPSQLIRLFESLLKWLLFNNEAFLEQISIPLQVRPAFHRGLLDWIETEIFRPEGSLPIVGQVNTRNLNYDQSDFGIVQRKFFDFLFPKHASKNSCRFSFTLLGLWYRNSCLKDWWNSTEGGDKCFWKVMSQSIKSAFKKKLTVSHPSELTEGISEELLGNFQVYDIQNSSNFSPSKFKKLYHKLIESTESGLIELRILKMINSIQSKIILGSKKMDFTSASVALVEVHFHNSGIPELKVIRILDQFHRLITPSKTMAKLSGLLKRISLYHLILCNSLESGKTRGRLGKANELLEWLKKRLLSFSHGVPIFGLFKKDFMIQEKNFFGEVQNYIIDYISKKAENLEGDRTAIAILGYWCKNEFPDFFKLNWDSDYLYWEFISDELRKYPVFKGR